MHHKKKALILHVNNNCYDYRNDPKFSDRQVYANSADPDQTAPRGAVWPGSEEQSDLGQIRVYTVCNTICIFWMHYSTVKPSCLNFRVIFSRIRIFRIFTAGKPVHQ